MIQRSSRIRNWRKNFFVKIGSFFSPIGFSIGFNTPPAMFCFMTGRLLEFTSQVSSFWKLEIQGYKTMLESKLIEIIFVYPFLSVIIAFSVVLSILTSDTFSLFTLFFVLFASDLYIFRYNAALTLLLTQQSCLYISKMCTKNQRKLVSHQRWEQFFW